MTEFLKYHNKTNSHYEKSLKKQIQSKTGSPNNLELRYQKVNHNIIAK